MGARTDTEVRECTPTYINGYGGWAWEAGHSGGGYRGPSAGFATEPMTFTKGTVAIDVFNVSTQSPIWHGQGSRNLSEAELENASLEKAKQAAANVLRDFPSRTEEMAYD